jgi:hypothetical protein
VRGGDRFGLLAYVDNQHVHSRLCLHQGRRVRGARRGQRNETFETAANIGDEAAFAVVVAQNTIGVVGDARNVVQFNRTGILLRDGVNSVVNTSVANNSIDGISIDGGSNAIGGSKSPDQNSNAVYGNGRWGIRMASAAVARLQRITGNFFGTERFGATPGKNFQGNVAVGNSAPASNLGLTPDKKTGIDKNGNQHSDIKGPAPKPRVTRPWRPRR